MHRSGRALSRVVRSLFLFLLGWSSLAAAQSDVPFFATSPVAPDVLVVIDGSYAMKLQVFDENGNPSDYSRAYYAADSVLDAVAAYPEIRWGLITTPSDTHVGESCSDACKTVNGAEVCVDVPIGQGDSSTMNAYLTAYVDRVQSIESTGSTCPRPRDCDYAWNKGVKDWVKSFGDGVVDTSSPRDALDEWVRATQEDPNKDCRKRIVLFVTSGGYAVDSPDCNGVTTAQRVEELYNDLESLVGEPLGNPNVLTYVLGFNLNDTISLPGWPGGIDDPGYLALEEIAVAGGTSIPRSARSQEEFQALLNDIISNVLEGTYSGANPVLSIRYDYLYQTYFDVYDRAEHPENYAWQGHLLAWPLDPETGEFTDGGGTNPWVWDSGDWLQNSVTWNGRVLYTAYPSSSYEVQRVSFDNEGLPYFADLMNVSPVGGDSSSETPTPAPSGTPAPGDGTPAPTPPEGSIGYYGGADVNCDGKLGTDTYDDPNDTDTAAYKDADALVRFVRGDQTVTYSPCDYAADVPGPPREPYKLLDIYRSAPRYLGPPASSYLDEDTYWTFQKTQANRDELVVALSNAGIFHGFQAAYVLNDEPRPSTTGREVWGYIPWHTLPKLQELWFNGHATLANATPTIADVYVRIGSTPTWRTVVIGGDGYLGDQARCEDAYLTGNNLEMWTCGFFTALDVTTPEGAGGGAVRPLWEFMGDGDLIYTSASPAITRVRMNSADVRQHVAIVAGMGVTETPSAGMPESIVPCASPVYFLDPGDAVQYRKLTLPYDACNPDNLHGVQARPMPVDTDGDFLSDRVYIGDMDGQLHRIDMSMMTPLDWSAERIFHPTMFSSTASHLFTDEGLALPITYPPTATYDSDGNIILYIGVGDPVTMDRYGTDPLPRGHLYVLLDNVSTGEVSLYEGFNETGFYELDVGEVIAGEPVIAGGVVYFTTYFIQSAAACDRLSGEARLYALDYRTGLPSYDLNEDGSVDHRDAYKVLGQGIPSGVVLGKDRIYVTLNTGEGGQPVSIDKLETIQPLLPYGWVEVTGR